MDSNIIVFAFFGLICLFLVVFGLFSKNRSYYGTQRIKASRRVIALAFAFIIVSEYVGNVGLLDEISTSVDDQEHISHGIVTLRALALSTLFLSYLTILRVYSFRTGTPKIKRFIPLLLVYIIFQTLIPFVSDSDNKDMDKVTIIGKYRLFSAYDREEMIGNIPLFGVFLEASLLIFLLLLQFAAWKRIHKLLANSRLVSRFRTLWIGSSFFGFPIVLLSGIYAATDKGWLFGEHSIQGIEFSIDRNWYWEPTFIRSLVWCIWGTFVIYKIVFLSWKDSHRTKLQMSETSSLREVSSSIVRVIKHDAKDIIINNPSRPSPIKKKIQKQQQKQLKTKPIIAPPSAVKKSAKLEMKDQESKLPIPMISVTTSFPDKDSGSSLSQGSGKELITPVSATTSSSHLTTISPSFEDHSPIKKRFDIKDNIVSVIIEDDNENMSECNLESPKKKIEAEIMVQGACGSKKKSGIIPTSKKENLNISSSSDENWDEEMGVESAPTGLSLDKQEDTPVELPKSMLGSQERKMGSDEDDENWDMELGIESKHVGLSLESSNKNESIQQQQQEQKQQQEKQNLPSKSRPFLPLPVTSSTVMRPSPLHHSRVPSNMTTTTSGSEDWDNEFGIESNPTGLALLDGENVGVNGENIGVKGAEMGSSQLLGSSSISGSGKNGNKSSSGSSEENWDDEMGIESSPTGLSLDQTQQPKQEQKETTAHSSSASSEENWDNEMGIETKPVGLSLDHIRPKQQQISESSEENWDDEMNIESNPTSLSLETQVKQEQNCQSNSDKLHDDTGLKIELPSLEASQNNMGSDGEDWDAEFGVSSEPKGLELPSDEQNENKIMNSHVSMNPEDNILPTKSVVYVEAIVDDDWSTEFDCEQPLVPTPRNNDSSFSLPVPKKISESTESEAEDWAAEIDLEFQRNGKAKNYGTLNNVVLPKKKEGAESKPMSIFVHSDEEGDGNREVAKIRMRTTSIVREPKDPREDDWSKDFGENDALRSLEKGEQPVHDEISLSRRPSNPKRKARKLKKHEEEPKDTEETIPDDETKAQTQHIPRTRVRKSHRRSASAFVMNSKPIPIPSLNKHHSTTDSTSEDWDIEFGSDVVGAPPVQFLSQRPQLFGQPSSSSLSTSPPRKPRNSALSLTPTISEKDSNVEDWSSDFAGSETLEMETTKSLPNNKKRGRKAPKFNSLRPGDFKNAKKDMFGGSSDEADSETSVDTEHSLSHGPRSVSSSVERYSTRPHLMEMGSKVDEEDSLLSGSDVSSDIFSPHVNNSTTSNNKSTSLMLSSGNGTSSNSKKYSRLQLGQQHRHLRSASVMPPPFFALSSASPRNTNPPSSKSRNKIRTYKSLPSALNANGKSLAPPQMMGSHGNVPSQLRGSGKTRADMGLIATYGHRTSVAASNKNNPPTSQQGGVVLSSTQFAELESSWESLTRTNSFQRRKQQQQQQQQQQYPPKQHPLPPSSVSPPSLPMMKLPTQSATTTSKSMTTPFMISRLPTTSEEHHNLK